MGRISRLIQRAAHREDGAALLIALMVIFVVTALSITVAGVTLAQVRPTQTDRKIVRTVDAAEAGFDAALSKIRSAQNSGGDGIIGKLPCTTGGRFNLAGQVSGSAGNSAYSVTVRYFTQDPTSKSEAWRTANAIPCSGAGGVTLTPTYALLQSKGTAADVPNSAAGSGNRNLETTYKFTTTNKNVAGGLIHVYNQDNGLCLDISNGYLGVSDNQTNQNKLYLVPCNPGDRGQVFTYTIDLHLQVTADNGTPMCLEAAPKKDDPIRLVACYSGTDTTNVDYWQQKWSYNDVGRFEGADPTQKSSNGLNGWCFTATGSPQPDRQQVVMRQECSGGYDTSHTWAPEAQVGAGASGAPQGNLVNYRYFGRCLDVTNQNVDWAWLIGFPCKQTPDPAKLTWNQVFSYDSTTKQFVTKSPQGNYCLQAGGTSSSSGPPQDGTIVTVQPCNTATAFQRWTYPAKTDRYETSYNVVTTNGLCMTLDVPLRADLVPTITDASQRGSLPQWGYITTRQCDGSTQQKWNAPPLPIVGGLQGTQEKVGG